jgi:hypothetical protein
MVGCNAAESIYLCSNAGRNASVPAGAIMNNEADNNEQEFLKACRPLYLELLDAQKREQAVKVPQYERD